MTTTHSTRARPALFILRDLLAIAAGAAVGLVLGTHVAQAALAVLL